MQLFPENATIDDKIQHVIIWILRISAAFALFFAIYQSNAEHILNGLMATVLLFIPDMIQRRNKVKLPIEYSFAIIIFLYSSLVLGNILDFYGLFPWWDDLLHASMGALFGFTGFIILYMLRLQKRLVTSNFLLYCFAFSFAVTFGVFWEIFEFSVDQFTDFNLQRGLTNADTTIDLITDSLGGLISVALGSRFMLHPDGNDLVSRFFQKFFHVNPHLKKQK